MSANDPDLLIKWAQDGLISLTPYGKINTVKFSVYDVNAIFEIEVSDRHIKDGAGNVWCKFLFDNYEAICRRLVDGMYMVYGDEILERAKIYHDHSKRDAVLLHVRMDPWMLRVSFENVIIGMSDEDLHHYYLHDYAVKVQRVNLGSTLDRNLFYV